jgi:hypothetical protein
MVSRPLKRIPRVFFGSKICLAFLILIVCHISYTSNRIAFFANAFSRRHRNQGGRQQQRRNHNGEIDTTIPLFAAIPFYVTEVKKEAGEADAVPAFLIETISGAPSSISGDAIYKTIANMCIDVFFKEQLDPTGKGNVKYVVIEHGAYHAIDVW